MNDQLNGGPLTNWLAIIGVISLIYWGWRITAALLRRRKEDPGAAGALATSIPEAAHGGTLAATPLAAPPDDIAAIAAAVYAIVGAHRIVRLEAVHPKQAWALEGRWMQQTSHKPR
jgi:hypothetical protein